jgi:hypothetical protein
MIIIVHGKDFDSDKIRNDLMVFYSRTNSCISYANYKFFILFLGWALVFCTYVAGTSLEYFIQFWQVKQRFDYSK